MNANVKDDAGTEPAPEELVRKRKAAASKCSSRAIRIQTVRSGSDRVFEFVVTEVSCGGYAEKVICNEWSDEGCFLVTSGGNHAIVWDFGEGVDGDPPVGKKEAAAICYGHERRVAVVAFGPAATDPQTQMVRNHTPARLSVCLPCCVLTACCAVDARRSPRCWPRRTRPGLC